MRELVDQIASAGLATHFQEALPEYPTFPPLVIRRNREATDAEAVRWIAGSLKTNQGAAALQLKRRDHRRR